jgi:CRISPR-associated protein Cas5t
MYYFFLEAYAPTASFRLPEAHTFQQTLPLPPVTTITGMMGAAVGLSLEEALEFVKVNKVHFGVMGTHSGVFRDLWKYEKIKASETISAVLIREFLYDLSLILVFAAEDEKAVQYIREAFTNPKYALTAGNSDDLLKVKYISPAKEQEIQPYYRFSYTVLAGDHGSNYESDIKIEELPLLQNIYMPRVYLLPTDFEFNGNERRVRKRQLFTFVDVPVKLKKPINGLLIGDKAVGLL